MTEEELQELQEFRDAGLVWLVNTAILHPRGYALSVDVEDGKVVSPNLKLIKFGEYMCFNPDTDILETTIKKYLDAELKKMLHEISR